MRVCGQCCEIFKRTTSSYQLRTRVSVWGCFDELHSKNLEEKKVSFTAGISTNSENISLFVSNMNAALCVVS